MTPGPVHINGSLELDFGIDSPPDPIAWLNFPIDASIQVHKPAFRGDNASGSATESRLFGAGMGFDVQERIFDPNVRF